MAEFDDSAFDAVDSFLGKTRDQENGDEPSAPVVSQKTAPSSRRLGVGAFRAPVEANETKAVISKRILQVGKKRKLRDDEEEEDQPLIGNDDDEEEDLGRTAIDNERPSAPTMSAALLAKVVLPEPKKKKKKKKGKRERQQHRAEENKSEESKTDDVEDTTEKADCDDTEGLQPNKRRKRPKIRSRQKNIYKDHRDQKPEHLIPGKRRYRGRPLTSATRAKLNLPPSKTSVKGPEHHLESHWDEQAHDNIDAMPLAVDACKDSGAPKGHHTRKKKKTKYKNLKV